jgi:hypothetical protein
MTLSQSISHSVSTGKLSKITAPVEYNMSNHVLGAEKNEASVQL